MHTTECLNQLRETGRMRWMSPAQGWIAEAEEVVSALARDGFEECKYTETRDPHCHSRGGVWQGLNRQTGAVASAVWIVSYERPHLVFTDVRGHRRNCVDHHLHLSADDAAARLAAVAVGDVHHIDAGHGFEQLAGHVIGRALT